MTEPQTPEQEQPKSDSQPIKDEHRENDRSDIIGLGFIAIFIFILILAVSLSYNSNRTPPNSNTESNNVPIASNV